MGSRDLHVFHLAARVLQPHLQLLLGFGAAAAQPLLELVVARRRDEDEARVQIGFLDELGALWMKGNCAV